MKIFRDGIEVEDIVIDDRTVLKRSLMGEDKIVCSVTVPRKLDLQVGDTVSFDGREYTMNRPAPFTKVSDVEFHYTVDFEGTIYRLLDKMYMLNGSSNFPLVGTLEDFVDLLISNINEIDSGWTKGTVYATGRKLLSFAGKSCREVLNILSDKFRVEFDIDGKTINFPERVETATSLTFEHGAGSGLYTLDRKNVDDGNTVTRVYGFGSSRNLDYSYRSGENRLVFENADTTRYLENTTEYGRIVEKVIVFEDIYPHFTGSVDTVSGDYLSVTCSAIDFDLNAYLLAGINAKIIFLTGDLMGNEFEISSFDNATKTVTFKSVLQNDDLTLPSATFHANPGDAFTFVDIKMPQAYVDAAEAELKTATQKWLDIYSQLRVKYGLDIDPRYVRNNAISLNIGDVVRLIDTGFAIDKQIRITAIEIPVKDPENVQAEISNYREEIWQKEVSTLLNDTLQIATQAKTTTENASTRILHFWYNPDTGRLEGDVDMDIYGNLFVHGRVEADDDVLAFVAESVSSSVLAALTAIAPLYKPDDSSVALNYSNTYFDVVEGALVIKDGVLTPSSHTHEISDINGLQDELDLKVGLSSVGVANGVAPLDSNGLIGTSYLPSFVDDVVEGYYYNGVFYADSGHTTQLTGQTGKIYLDLTPTYPESYRWGGSAYIKIYSGAVDSVNGETGVVTLTTSHITEGSRLYYTNARVKAYADTLYRPIDWVPGWTEVTGKPSWFDQVSYDGSTITIAKDLHVSGQITAEDDVWAYVSGAVSSTVLSNLTALAPLYKDSDTTIGLNYSTTYFDVVNGSLVIKDGVLTPTAHTHEISDINGLQSALDGKEPLITKSQGYAYYTGTAWSFKNETYSLSTHNHNGVYEPVFSKNTAFNKNFGTAAGTVAQGNHTHSGVYEPVFSKNTAFNKDFGISAGTVAEGDHDHDGDYLGISANAVSASRWATARTLTLTGDVSGSASIDGSGNVSMTTAVANDSHTHDGRYFTESETDSRYFRRDTSNAVDVRLAPSNGRGLRFWDSDSYKIWMSGSTESTWGGRLDSSSDYNMYFRMTGGTNRGFVFMNGIAAKAQIEGSGQFRTVSNIIAGGYITVNGYKIEKDSAGDLKFNGGVYVAGALDATGEITAYTSATASDGRLKREVEADLLKPLRVGRPMAFYWNDLAHEEHGVEQKYRHFSFIAQEVKEYMPGAVRQGHSGYYNLSKEEFIAPLVAGWQYHEQERLKAKAEREKILEQINNLTGRLRKLETLLK